MGVTDLVKLEKQFDQIRIREMKLHVNESRYRKYNILWKNNKNEHIQRKSYQSIKKVISKAICRVVGSLQKST